MKTALLESGNRTKRRLGITEWHHCKKLSEHSKYDLC